MTLGSRAFSPPYCRLLHTLASSGALRAETSDDAEVLSWWAAPADLGLELVLGSLMTVLDTIPMAASVSTSVAKFDSLWSLPHSAPTSRVLHSRGCQQVATYSTELCSNSSSGLRLVAVPKGHSCEPLQVTCKAIKEGQRAGAKAEVKDGSGFVTSKLAVFLSGGGSNFQALHRATQENLIYGQVAVLVSDKPGCKGCEYAREHGIDILAYPRGKNAPDGISSSELVEKLRHYGVDYILLAGYLKLLPLELVQAYPRSILNIHPALLPAFGGKGYYGMKVHEAVIKSGARFSGPTIHYIDEKYDTGPILAQRIVPVFSDDTPHALAARVLQEEHQLYVEAVAALCEDRIFWRDDGVPLIRRSWDKAEYY